MSNSLKRWQRINQTFEQGVALPPGEHAAFLAARCGDAEERNAVEALLKAHSEAGARSFLEGHLKDSAIGWNADSAPPAEDMPKAGERLGPYRLLRKIDSGGMGTVYLASRDDATYEKRVAVKLIRESQASEDALRRMRIERQILASLEHPGIAALYDGGATASGAPYFVMEYVDGLRIDAYSDQHRLGLAQRIDLFLQVCKAVEFAHRNLIVHRDIKPSNILVTSDGNPKLLDFGIAKLLNPNLARGEIEATQYWMRVLTPGYSSPEQVLGRPVTTASDVYSLGALLFKLLTGRLPFPPEDEYLALTDELLEREAPLASRIVRDEESDESITRLCRLLGWHRTQLSSKLSGDLDSILAKALRGPSERRYGTVAEFTEDLRRYQHNLPVLARQGKLRYHAGKFLRRHALSVSTAALVFALILGFGVTMLLQFEQVRRERDTKDAVIEFVVQLFEVADAYLRPGADLTVLEALQFAETSKAKADLEPEAQAALATVIGRVYLGLGETTRAQEQFQQLHEAQVGLYGAESLEAAEALSLMSAAVRLSKEETLRLAKQAVDMTRSLVGNDALELVVPLNRLVNSFCVWQDYESAAPFSEEALTLARRWYGPLSIETGIALAHQAAILKSREKLAEAEELYRQVLNILENTRPKNHPDIADVWSNIADLEGQLNEPEKSEGTYREVLRMQRAAFDGLHPNIARTLNNLSDVLFELNRYDESVQSLEEAIKVNTQINGSQHFRSIWLEIALARRLTTICRAEEARDLLKQRLGTWTELESNLHTRLHQDAEKALAEAEASSCPPDFSKL